MPGNRTDSPHFSHWRVVGKLVHGFGPAWKGFASAERRGGSVIGMCVKFGLRKWSEFGGPNPPSNGRLRSVRYNRTGG